MVMEQIKLHTCHDENGEWKEDNKTVNLVAHAILGAVVAELQGNSALAGGLGAAYGERSTEIIAKILYPGKAIDKLSQDEKQQVNALAQLSTGLTTAALGSDAQDINTAMAGGKNAFENNGGSFENANGMAPLIDWHDSYGQAYDSAIKAPNLTEEEILELFEKSVPTNDTKSTFIY